MSQAPSLSLFSRFCEDFSPEMCYATEEEVTGRVSQHAQTPPINVDPPRAHPTPFSITGVPGEVSRQRVASFFPFASHSWLGAPGHEEGKEQTHATALLS